MKIQELTLNEMSEINGGSNLYATGISLSSSAGNLLTLTFEYNYGGRNSRTTLSLGNNIDLGFSALSNASGK